MKIPPVQSLTLPSSLTESLNGKDIFRVRILARESPNSALAEINGIRVRAHFTGGIPLDDHIRIVRDGSSRDRSVFRILSEQSAPIPTSLLQRFRLSSDGSFSWPLSLSLLSLLRSGKERAVVN
jgi:hypothetical protein